MNFEEKITTQFSRGEMVPLKGHCKITLSDALTGKPTDVIEKDNMVTNAVRDVLNSNFEGTARFQTLMPLKNLFSGVMLFQENIAENANGYAIPSDLVNPMIGNAGPDPHSTASIYRGNPNGVESQETPTSMKFVWDWSTSAGNGRINCVSLCPGTMGNIGLKPFDNTQNPLSAFGSVQRYHPTNALNEEFSMRLPFLRVNDQYHYSIWINGTTFKERKVIHDYTKFGVMRNVDSYVLDTERTATIRARATSRVFVYDGVHDGVDYYYVMSCTGATTIMIDRIRKSDMAVDTLDVQCSDTSFYTGEITSRNGCLPVFAISGDYLYFPNNTKTQFYKINLYNNADVSLLPGEVTIDYGRGDSQYRSGEQFASPLVLSEGLVLGSTWIINGGNTYPLKRPANIGCQNTYYAYANALWMTSRENYPAAHFGYAYQSYGSEIYDGPTNVLCPTFLSTICNLEDEISKSSSKTMKVEYTITEA